jgi:hypothetical protein
MKTTLIASLLAVSALSASAADYVSVDVEGVHGLKGGTNSTAQYVRAGKSFGDYQLGIQSRTATVSGGGMLNSTEITAANNRVSYAGITPFVGIGHDNGFNAPNNGQFTYGLVGATTGVKVGPGFALLGVKTRVASDERVKTKQTVAFTTYSVPVAKNVAVNLNASKSFEDIKENAFGLGVSFSF